jgi:hypothetical protein
MKKLYKLYIDVGRMGSLTGSFVREESDTKKLIGRTVYFGEILGKHSNIYETIEEGHITEVTDDQDFIEKAEKYGLDSVGVNPFDYIDEYDEEDDD